MDNIDQSSPDEKPGDEDFCASRDFVTIIRSVEGKRLTKRHCADGSVQPYDNVKWCSSRQVPLAGPDDLAKVLAGIQPTEALVFGEFREPSPAEAGGHPVGADKHRRRLRPDNKVTPPYPQTYHPVAHHFAGLDVDGPAITDDGWLKELAADPTKMPAAVAALVPPELHGAECVWTLTSSAGRPGAGVRMRLFPWFAEPTTAAQICSWIKRFPALDASVLTANQPIYVAAPLFDPGVVDPIAARGLPRMGRFHGARKTISLPSAPEIKHTRQEAPPGLIATDGDPDVLAALAAEIERFSSTANGKASTRTSTGAGTYKLAKLLFDLRVGNKLPSFDDVAGSLVDHWVIDPDPDAVMETVENAADGRDNAPGCRLAGKPPRAPLNFPDMDPTEPDTESDSDPAVEDSDNVVDLGTIREARTHQQADPKPEPKARTHLIGSELVHLGPAFVKVFRDRFCWSPETQWLEYTTHRGWDRRDKNPAPFGAASALLAHTVKAGFMQVLQAKELRKIASRSTARAVVEYASWHMPAGLPNEWDCEPFLLNTPDGIVDLETGVLRSRTPRDKHLHCTAVSPKLGPCPVWDNFITGITRDNAIEGDGYRPELAQYLERLVATWLTGFPHQQVVFLLGTNTASNGKSTLVEFMQYLLGDYAAVIKTSALLETTYGGHDTDLADMVGARLVTTSEAAKTTAFNEPLLKRLTGADTITTRRLYCNPFSFRPTHHLVISSNHEPTFKDCGPSMRRRVRAVPFDFAFLHSADNKRLKYELQAEAPQILARLISLRPSVEEPEMPDCVKEKTDAIFGAETANPHLRWLRERCVVGEFGTFTPIKALYDDCHGSVQGSFDQVGVTQPMSPRAFVDYLLAADARITRMEKPKKIDGRAQKVLAGIRLKGDADAWC